MSRTLLLQQVRARHRQRVRDLRPRLHADLLPEAPFILALLGGAVLAGISRVLVERFVFRPLRVRGADP